MKKRILFVLGAFAVLGLSACVEQQDVNPNFDPVTKTVNTQFVLNIAAADGATSPETKMSSTITQANKRFRGINDATLYAFALKDGETYLDGKKLVTVPEDLRSTNMFRLPTALTSDVIPSGNLAGNRVLQLSLTEGVNNVLFYGKASKDEDNPDYVGLNTCEVFGELEYGALDGSLGDVVEYPGKIYSQAKRRLESSSLNAFNVIEAINVAMLNGLIRVGFNDASSYWANTVKEEITDGSLSLDLTSKKIYWKDYMSALRTGISPVDNVTGLQELERMLGNAYSVFVTISDAEKRSGSGHSLERQLADIYSIVKAGSAATPYHKVEIAAKEMCKIILGILDQFFVHVVDPSTNTDVLTYRGASAIHGMLITNYHVSLPSFPSSFPYTMSDFPVGFNLPLGAVTLKSEAPEAGGDGFYTFSYSDNEDLGTGGTSYAYPPELCYFCNSPLRTSNSAGITDQSYPVWSNTEAGRTAWLDWRQASIPDGGTAEWVDGTHVTSQTRGVAVKYPVEYGMALLDATVIVGSADATSTGTPVTLKDNNSHFNPTEEDKEITLGTTNKLEWTGILIGGQPDKVNWMYHKLDRTGVGFNTIIYDKVAYRQQAQSVDDGNGGTTTVYVPTWGVELPKVGPLADHNYTILFDNYDKDISEGTAQTDVLVALEFVNRLNTDFWGAENIVRDGGTFYLLARLSPDGQSFGGFKTESMLPPYYDQDVVEGGVTTHHKGDTKNILRVFMGDYVTRANFILGPDALKKAFITVPDLRSARLNLGLQVDIDWTEGVTYIVQLGQTGRGN